MEKQSKEKFMENLTMVGKLNGQAVKRVKDTIFVRLPRELWRSAGKCSCPICGGREGFWDTLAVGKDAPKGHGADYAWTVHYPEFSGYEQELKNSALTSEQMCPECGGVLTQQRHCYKVDCKYYDKRAPRS